jgi:hypothetical protein
MRARFVIAFLLLVPGYLLLSRQLGLIHYDRMVLVAIGAVAVFVSLLSWRLHVERVREIDHTTLGRLESADGKWWQTTKPVKVWTGRSVRFLLKGNAEGPFPDSAQFVDYFRSEPTDLFTELQSTIEEVRRSYLLIGEASSSLDSPPDVGEGLQAITVVAPAEFELTYHFPWQRRDDPHDVTIGFSAGDSTGCSFDG